MSVPEHFLKSMLFVSLGFPPEVKAVGGLGGIGRSERRSRESLSISTKAAANHASLNRVCSAYRGLAERITGESQCQSGEGGELAG